MKVAIIGSGLAAVSASKALVKRGIKPILLDVGQQIEKEKTTLVENMSKIEPIHWDSLDRDAITDNPTIKGNDLPKKLLYGSNYFYGTSTNNARIEGTGPMPPFSYAKGGFSAGWGAAVLPPDDCDLDGWPIKNKELSKYYKEVLDDIPYSACNDELAENFPLFSDKYSPLQLTVGNKNLLQDFLILAGVIGLCSFIKPICVYLIAIIKRTNQLWKKRFKYIYLFTIYFFHYIFYYYVSTNNPDLTLFIVGISHSIVTLVIVLLVEKLLFNSDIL